MRSGCYEAFSRPWLSLVNPNASQIRAASEANMLSERLTEMG